MSRLFRDIEGGPRCPHGSVVCIGAFDGLHLGHQALVRRTVERARDLGLPAVALTFEPLPREFFAPSDPPPRLLLPRDRIDALFGLGVDQIGLLRFDGRLSALTATGFASQVLARRVSAREVWVGPEFRFGKGRAGDIAVLREAGEVLGFTAHEIAPLRVGDERVSSTLIRSALQAGDFAHAARLLGRPYAIGGRVVHGGKLGRTLGFPTANLRFGGKRPALSGIFATWTHFNGERHASVASLGTRPTVNGVELLLETHLFDFEGDLYGKRIEVEFVAKLRDEMKFPDLSTLTEQMRRDAGEARALLSRTPQRVSA